MIVKRRWTQAAGTVLGSLEELSAGENMSRSNWQQDQAAIKELQLILDSCKLGLTPVDEVWPDLYIGNV